MEENSNIQEEVKTEIKQGNNQDDEIEILEVEEVKEKKDFSNVLSGIFKNKKIITAAGIVAVVIAAAVTCVVISVNKRGTKQTLAVEETTTQAETVTQEQTTEEPKKLENLMLEANADESSITAHFVNESGEAVTGHNFAVRLLSGSIEENQEKVDKLKNDKKSGIDNLKESTAVQTQENGSLSEDVVAQTGATEYEDDNQDGEVVITDLNEGTYTLVAKAYEGFALLRAAVCSFFNCRDSYLRIRMSSRACLRIPRFVEVSNCRRSFFLIAEVSFVSSSEDICEQFSSEEDSAGCFG